MVKYHNDFQKIRLNTLNEQEQNILFTIFTKMQEKTDFIILTPQDLKLNDSFSSSSLYLTDIIESLKEKFFKIDFTFLVNEKENIVAEHTINMFQNMTIYYENIPPRKKFLRVEMKINETFQYILGNLGANFTMFELVEFVNLSGKYTKNIYRFLKQYRNTGFFTMEWEKFCEYMGIPKSYKMCDIEKQILKPAVAEFRKKKIFKNLSYKKTKTKGNGNKITDIEFYFSPKKIEAKKTKKIAITETIYFESESEKQEYLRSKYAKKISN